MIGRWRPPLRVALRSARRHPGRTALVAALVAAPVLGTAFLDTAYRTSNLDLPTQATRQMGAADATLTVTDGRSIRITGNGTSYDIASGTAKQDPATVDPARSLPAGSTVLPRRPDGSVSFVTGDRTTLARSLELALGDPLAAGLLTVKAGRPATAAGEITLSRGLAGRLGVGIGDDVRAAGTGPLRVVGLVADPSCLSCQFAAGPPGWTGQPEQPVTDWLVGLPSGVQADRDLQSRLAGAGLFLRPRDTVLHPDAWGTPDSGGGDPTLLAVIVLVAGLGLLEVILLAGTAFAVAARRQVRDAALVLSNGGRRSDVRRMLLAQGAVLGLLGAATGLVLGVLAVPLSRGGLERLSNQEFGRLILSPRDLAIAAAAGLLAGVAAAVVPAWSAARVPVVAALAGRHTAPARTRRRLAVAAAVVAVLGLVLAGLVAARWQQQQRTGAGTGVVYPLAMLLGFGLTMVALTVLAPTLVGLAGKLAGRLSLTGRLAVRDAARHRHRTGPAVGAVMVAVAGSVAVAFALASYDQRDRESYQPALPTGWASVYLDTSANRDSQLAAVRSAAAELPTSGAVPIQNADPRDDRFYVQAGPPEGSDCAGFGLGVGLGEPTARLATGAGGDRAAAALAAGKAVVTEACMAPAGVVRIVVAGPIPDDDSPTPEHVTTVPAVVVDSPRWGALPGTVLPAAAAQRLGLVPDTSQVVIPTSRVPTSAEEDRARTALGPLAGLFQVEHGYGKPYLPGFIALIGGAGLVTLAGVAISVTLSAAEGRADLATLAAIGAPPRRRRGLAMAQAALVAGLGVGLGLLFGAAVGLTIMSGLPGYPLVVPWLPVLVVGVGVPVLGVVAVGLLTRSKLPMVRRLA